MGIQSPNSFLWRTDDIDWKVPKTGGANGGSIVEETHPVLDVLRLVHTQRKDGGATNRDNPGVAFDANAIGYKHRSRSILAIREAAQAFVQKGVDVTIVFDGESRHQSKRDAINRRASRAKDQVELVELRSQLLAIGVGPNATDEDVAKADEIGSKIRRLEAASSVGLPSNFVAQVKSQLDPIATQFSGQIKFMVAPHQADPSLARLALRREVEAIITTDSDFALYVGPGEDGKSDLMLKPEIVSGSIRSCQLSTSQSTAAEFIEELGHSWSNQPKHPLFDGVKEPRVRALIAVAVGCDANPGGIHGFGPSKVKDLTAKQSTFDGLVIELGKLGCKKRECTEKHSHISSPEGLACLVDSLLCEVTNAGPLHSEPDQLGKCNHDFAYVGTEKLEGPSLTTCSGYPGQDQSHDFITEEGVFRCSNCHQEHCRFCICSSGLCISCSYDQLSGCQINKTQEEMKAFLVSKKHVLPATISYQDLAGMCLDELDQSLICFDKAIDGVTNPLLASDSLKQESLNSKESRLQLVAQAPLKDASSFLRMDSISTSQKAELIGLMAELTRFSTRSEGALKPEHVMPRFVLGMIDNSRIHDGGRLKARAIRHTMDVQTPKLIDATISLATLDGNSICLAISGHKVKASMKPNLYNVMTAFNRQNLVACSCNCKAGCKATSLESQRIVCTHSVTPLLQLSRLLFSGLAEHILVELRSLLEKDDFTSSRSSNKLGREESKAFTSNVKRLIATADKPGHPTPLIGTQSVTSMLESFAVGTAKGKDVNLPMPSKSSMGLHRFKGKAQQPALKLENELAKRDSTNPTTTTTHSLKPKCLSPSDLEELSHKTKATLDALDLVFDQSYKGMLGKKLDCTPIGHQLLNHRANKKGGKVEFLDCNKTVQELCHQLTKAMSNATVRGNKAVKKRKASPPQAEPPKKKVADPAKRVRKPCCVEGCDNPGTKRVPPMPKLNLSGKNSSAKATNKKLETHARKRFIRQEWTDRLAMGRKCDSKAELRHCGGHPMVQVTGKQTTHKSVSGETKRLKIEPFNCIDGCGQLSSCAPAVTPSSGVGRDRWTARHATTLDENAKLVSVVLDELECDSPLQPKTLPTTEDPVFEVESLTSQRVKAMTGFSDAKAMLKMVAIYCGGEVEMMTSTTSKLTWLEEWLFFFDFIHGRTAIRWEDHTSKWKSAEQVLRRVLKDKLKVANETRNKWPAHATFEEDCKFRCDSWNLHFPTGDGPRIVMHDGSNIPERQPSDAELNRATHSLCCKMNCSKTVVSNQLCSWIRSHNGVTGRMGDGDMVEELKLLEHQQEFLAWDPSNKKPFTNVFDKGFRCTTAARNAGGQKVLQPTFARSDEQFTRAETLHSAAVAVVRSGNERAVNRVKYSWFLLRGKSLQPWDVELVDDILLAWSFQVNFMCDKFL